LVFHIFSVLALFITIELKINTTPHTTLPFAQKALTPADGTLEKLLKRTSRQLLLSVGVSGSYGSCAKLFL